LILYTDENQEKTVETVLEEFKKKRTFREKVVTELSPLQAFYRAEEYHQDYFANHPEQPYFKMIIRPKIGKVQGTFREFSKVQYPCNEDMHCVEFAIGC
jgi:peptide methionine sulfoxide reductase MsrA